MIAELALITVQDIAAAAQHKCAAERRSRIHLYAALRQLLLRQLWWRQLRWRLLGRRLLRWRLRRLLGQRRQQPQLRLQLR